jgi:tannase/feruloyl esterase
VRLAAALLAGAWLVAPAVAQNQHACADLKQFAPAGLKLEIEKTEAVPATPPGVMRISPLRPGTVDVPVPAFCRVDGAIDRRTGADGKTYAIGFALALPDRWNGRFLFQGGGGLNGSVWPPLGAQAVGNTPALARGFAVVSTDTGHKGSVFDGSFFRDQQASLDFYYVAIGRVAVLAKQMIAWYYGRGAEHSYFSGCSTGGREGMIMSQRYPAYFDGIVAGAPAMRTGYSNLALARIASAFSGAAPKDTAGKPAMGQLLSDSDRKLIVDSLLKACDALDGVKDGMVFYRDACPFDPSVLTCPGAKTDSCLSVQQVNVLGTIEGLRTSRGDVIYPAYPWDVGMGDSQGLPGLLHGPVLPVPVPVGAGGFDIDREFFKVESNAGARLGDSTWTNLSAFAAHGGKLLFYHGLSDPWFSPLDTVSYYEHMGRDTTATGPVTTWSRLYLSPGMGHCGGGSAALDQFDMLTAVVDWVEQGRAPDSVVATGKAFPGRSRPLCAYPMHAQYKGQGDTNEAASFVCKE